MFENRKQKTYRIERDAERGVDVYIENATGHVLKEVPVTKETKPKKSEKEKK